MRRSCTTAILLILLLASACTTAEPAEPTPTPLPARPETTFTVARGPLVQKVAFNGSVQPALTAEASFRSDGRIRSVYVEANQPVTKGMLLADLTLLDDLQSELEQVRQQAASEEAANAEILRRAEIHHEIAQLNLQRARQQGLSEAEVRIAELQLELASLDLEDVRAALTENDYTARIAELEAAIAGAHLYAPMDGELLTSLAPGKTVRAHAPVAVVGDPSSVELVAAPTDDQMKSLVEGMPVSVVFEKNPGQIITGSIRELPYPFGSGPAASGRGGVRIALDVSPQSGGYLVGDTAQITIILAESPSALWLPPKAVRSVAGRSFVLVRLETGIQRIDVVTGLANRDQLEILEGLSEGQVVIAP